MGRRLEIVESEDAIQVRIEPPQRGRLIVFLWTVSLFSGWGAFREIWFLMNVPMGGFYPFHILSALLLMLIALFALSGLIGQFATVVLTFERLALALERRLFGMRLRRRWYGADEVHELRFGWFGSRSRLTFRIARNTLIQPAHDIDEDETKRLLLLLRDRGFSYADGSEEIQWIDPRDPDGWSDGRR